MRHSSSEKIIYHMHLPNAEFSWLQNHIFANQYGCIVLEVVYSFAEAGAGSVNREYQSGLVFYVLRNNWIILQWMFVVVCLFFPESSMKAIIVLLICLFTYRYIYVPMGGSQSSLPGMLFSTALTFAFVSYWHGGQSYLWYWGVLNWLGVIVENGVKRILSVSPVQDLIVSWSSLHFVFLFLSSMFVCNSWVLVCFNLD